MFNQEEIEMTQCIRTLLNNDNIDELEALETHIEMI